MHSLLSGECDESLVRELNPNGYSRWLFEEFDGTHKALDAVSVDIRARAINETNFHLMNDCSFAMWQPLMLEGWASPQHRAEILNGTQFAFAFRGLEMYAKRQAFIRKAGGTHALFDPDNKEYHEALTGVMQEYDAAIVLIDFIRKQPHLALLPAPLQFERINKRTNVDFVVVDVDAHRAVGVQVKSRLRSEDFDTADADRVVFIDGDTDLGNIKLVRTQKARSTEKITAWPGIIAAKKMLSFKAHGKHVRRLSVSPAFRRVLAERPQLLVERQLLARGLVGDIKVNYEDLALVIGERILRKL